MIAIPTALQIFCWIATIWAGRPVENAAAVRAGFFFILLIGGLTGVMLASVPLDSRSMTPISSSRTCTTC